MRISFLILIPAEAQYLHVYCSAIIVKFKLCLSLFKMIPSAFKPLLMCGEMLEYYLDSAL